MFCVETSRYLFVEFCRVSDPLICPLAFLFIVARESSPFFELPNPGLEPLNEYLVKV